MSIEAMSNVWKYSRQKGSGLLLLLAIADSANDSRDGAAWPSVDHLALKCRMTRRNVQLLIKKLCEEGVIDVRENAGPNGVNIYYLSEDRAKTFHPTVKSFHGENSCPEISPNPLGTVIDSSVPPTPKVGKIEKTQAVEMAQRIYEAYPKKVAKLAAIQSILRAMKRIDPAQLLTKTESFTKAWSAETSMEFCPHPSTWFNQGRYDDDPNTWTRRSGPDKRPISGASNGETPHWKRTPAQIRNGQITGAESVRKAILQEMANPEPAPWD